MPLVRSWWLGKKKGKEAFVIPRVVDDTDHPAAGGSSSQIGHDIGSRAEPENDGTVGRRARSAWPANRRSAQVHPIRRERNGLGQQADGRSRGGQSTTGLPAADRAHVDAAGRRRAR